ncbi:hypothetical protein AKJ29_04420 [Aliiroseovarius crassostreae]|uniref:Type IV pilus biogenesis protein PilP n=1 Tax=Aliiroseovarius crassostreae TaxID=154981 RepID=A0A0P7HZ63_9RHOB|nr:hypothetical protein [Aliiroseovarius crassostreae]KPN61868.1 hypothetical protein AKJ29_04420 [Aliiroseovarius crassostreae]
MTPGFALDLTHEGIALMHRGKGGWSLVGEVKLDAADLPAQLGMMRQRAVDLNTGGFATSLIIPPSQLLFTTMTAPGPDDITREARIREGLEGLTPYPVDKLVFDWYADGDMAHVAVVVRETLKEAESFAVENRLNPVAFMARPHGSYERVACFGKTACAAEHLPEGATVNLDELAPPILMGTGASLSSLDTPALDAAQTDTPEVTANAPLAEPEENASTQDGEKQDDTAPTADTAPVLAPFPPDFVPEEKSGSKQPQKEAGKSGDQSLAGQNTEQNTDKQDRDRQDSDQRPDAPASAPRSDMAPPSALGSTSKTPSSDTGNKTPAETSAPPAFASQRSGQDAQAGGKTAPSVPTKTVATRLHITPPTAPTHRPQEVHVPVTAPSLEGAENKTITPPAEGTLTPQKTDNTARPHEAKAAKKPEQPSPEGPLSANEDKAGKPPVAAPAQPAKPKRPAQKTSPGATATQSNMTVAPPPGAMSGAPKIPQPGKAHRSPSETDAMTVFGARRSDTPAGQRKYLGLILVLGLLLMMAILAVWSMFFLSDQASELFPDQPDQFESAITTGQDSIDAAELEAEPEAAEDLDVTDAAAPEGFEQLSQEVAATRYAATGIWERAPDAIVGPPAGAIDDLYVASIDPEGLAHDAVALPDIPLQTLASGTQIGGSHLAPPPKGTKFDLDENGFVRPTAEGSLTRDGVMVFAGLPPRVPPIRPDGLFAETSLPAPVTADPALAGKRPLLRPEGLVLTEEERLFAGRTRQELATPAPTLRPAGLISQGQAVAQAESIANAVENAAQVTFVSPTERAITRSLLPRPRPGRFDKIVSSAPSVEDASDGSVVIAATPPNQVVTPALPTRASVAKQATMKNAIPLRKVALIGIYGSAAKRQALVRLSNGRYVKVGVGDRLDGGRVVSISEGQLVYKKGSRTNTLKILPFS